MNTPDFDARARDIVNGYGYLCADRMNDWNILQFASIVSAALLQAFEDGKICERKIAIGEPIDLDKAFGCQATVTAGGTASSSALPPLQTDGGGDAWQPIDTAPNEERYDGWKGRFLVVDADDFMDVAQSDDDFSMWDFEPTHWRHLPKGPHIQRPFEEPEQREGDEPDPQVETLA